MYASSSRGDHDRRFLRALVDCGWDVSHVRFDGRGRDGEIIDTGLGSEVDWLGSSSQRQFSTAFELRSQFSELVQARKPDVVLAGPLSTVLPIVANCGVPVIGLSWGFDVLRDTRLDLEVAQAVRDALSSCLGVVVDSDASRIALEDLGFGSRPVLNIPWGIDLSQFPFVDRLPGSPIDVVSLRSFEDVYDLETLLLAVDAFRSRRIGFLRSVSLAGSGSLENGLRQLSRTSGLEDVVRFLGRLNEENVPELLGRSNVYVSTSLVDGSSLSLIQALASGLTPIVVDSPSNREWVRDGFNGLLFPAGDHLALCKALEIAGEARSRLEKNLRDTRREVEVRANWIENVKKLDNFLRGFCGC